MEISLQLRWRFSVAIILTGIAIGIIAIPAGTTYNFFDIYTSFDFELYTYPELVANFISNYKFSNLLLPIEILKYGYFVVMAGLICFIVLVPSDFTERKNVFFSLLGYIVFIAILYFTSKNLKKIENEYTALAVYEGIMLIFCLILYYICRIWKQTSKLDFISERRQKAARFFNSAGCMLLRMTILFMAAIPITYLLFCKYINAKVAAAGLAYKFVYSYPHDNVVIQEYHPIYAEYKAASSLLYLIGTLIGFATLVFSVMFLIFFIRGWTNMYKAWRTLPEDEERMLAQDYIDEAAPQADAAETTSLETENADSE